MNNATFVRLIWIVSLACSLAARGGEPAKAAVKFRPYAHAVTTWVPPYGVAKARAQLDAVPGVKDSLTHLAMQFWTPTAAGGVERVKSEQVTDDAVAGLRNWAHAHGIRAMLCVYNAAGKTWDWPLARGAFGEHRAAFVKALAAEVERLGLDGVDVDLEGAGEFEGDRKAFVSFMAELSKALHAGGRHLTVDTFAYKWNAPNQAWWGELLPLVDALVSMGYDETGAAAADWRSYAAQVKAAGKLANRLQLGMPSDKDQWRGGTAAEQLEWVRKTGQTGVGIWDAQLPAAAWRTEGAWKTVREIRGGG